MVSSCKCHLIASCVSHHSHHGTIEGPRLGAENSPAHGRGSQATKHFTFGFGNLSQTSTWLATTLVCSHLSGSEACEEIMEPMHEISCGFTTEISETRTKKDQKTHQALEEEVTVYPSDERNHETLECLAQSLRIDSHKLHSLALHVLFHDSAFGDPFAVACLAWPLIDLNY